MAGLLRFCHGSSKTVIRPPNFRGERAIKEGAGLGNGGRSEQGLGSEVAGRSGTGRQRPNNAEGWTSRQRWGGGRRSTKHQERTERAENRWLKKGKRKDEKPQSGENLCLHEMHMLHCKDKTQTDNYISIITIL